MAETPSASSPTLSASSQAGSSATMAFNSEDCKQFHSKGWQDLLSLSSNSNAAADEKPVVHQNSSPAWGAPNKPWVMANGQTFIAGLLREASSKSTPTSSVSSSDR